MSNEKDSVTFTSKYLAALRARGGSQSDLARVRAKTEEELEQDIAGDPDFRDVPRDWFESAEAVMPVPKTFMSIRLDSEVVDWFKGQGAGYQTRINAALLAFVRAKKKASA